MLDFLIDRLQDPRFLAMILAAIGGAATVYTLITPLLVTDPLKKRMKLVANERERLRQRERERINRSEKVSLRQSPRQLVSKVVNEFNLSKWVGQEEAREKLSMA